MTSSVGAGRVCCKAETLISGCCDYEIFLFLLCVSLYFLRLKIVNMYYLCDNFSKELTERTLQRILLLGRSLGNTTRDAGNRWALLCKQSKLLPVDLSRK